MKYENGGDIFPERLLRQIQKYVSGQLVYIPAREQKRAWGETSGYKRYLWERNRAIRERFGAGHSVDALAEEYCLSGESIKKIVYSKEEPMLEYQRTLSSAMEYARAGKLEDWVHAYLLTHGHNREFSDGLKLFDRTFFGPVNMPLRLFARCCGPEEGMRWRMDPVWWEKRVEDLMRVLQTEQDMPPLIAHFVEEGFELNDGNHRFEALTRLGVKEYPFVIWITEPEECKEFEERFKEYL